LSQHLLGPGGTRRLPRLRSGVHDDSRPTPRGFVLQSMGRLATRTLLYQEIALHDTKTLYVPLQQSPLRPQLMEFRVLEPLERHQQLDQIAVPSPPDN